MRPKDVFTNTTATTEFCYNCTRELKNLGSFRVLAATKRVTLFYITVQVAPSICHSESDGFKTLHAKLQLSGDSHRKHHLSRQ